MKSSFSWPGRPPAEMISRNMNRLLTSILGGSPKRGAFGTSILDGTLKRDAFCTSILDGTSKRGAFCTSILDGTPKRGAFYTSILDGTLKRGAFCTSILDGTPKRGAFCTSILDGALKRDAFFGRQGRGVSNTPPKRSRMGTRVAKGSQTRDSLSPAGPFDGAYAIRPYDGTSKEGAFCTSILDGALKRDAFFGRKGRGVSNTPSKRSRMGTRVAKGGQTSDSLPSTGPFDGAYAIRPYDGTSKEGVFCTSYLVATLKRGAFCTSYLVATLKRGAFCTSYLVGTPKRGAFCTSYLVGTPKRDAFGD